MGLVEMGLRVLTGNGNGPTTQGFHARADGSGRWRQLLNLPLSECSDADLAAAFRLSCETGTNVTG